MATTKGPRRRERVNIGLVPDLGALAAGRRLTLGLTQQELADLADVGVSSVRALEAGQDTTTLAIVVRILDALGLALGVATRTALLAVPNAVLVGRSAPVIGPVE